MSKLNNDMRRYSMYMVATLNSVIPMMKEAETEGKNLIEELEKFRDMAQDLHNAFKQESAK